MLLYCTLYVGTVQRRSVYPEKGKKREKPPRLQIGGRGGIMKGRSTYCTVIHRTTLKYCTALYCTLCMKYTVAIWANTTISRPTHSAVPHNGQHTPPSHIKKWSHLVQGHNNYIITFAYLRRPSIRIRCAHHSTLLKL